MESRLFLQAAFPLDATLQRRADLRLPSHPGGTPAPKTRKKNFKKIRRLHHQDVASGNRG